MLILHARWSRPRATGAALVAQFAAGLEAFWGFPLPADRCNVIKKDIDVAK
jgi:hypothetical protein